MLKQNNVMVICTSSEPAECVGTHILPTLMQHCPTHIYVPDDITFNYTSPTLGLEEEDNRLLRRMERLQGDFLLKQNHETIGLHANLAELDEFYPIFANDSKSLLAASKKLMGSKP